MDGGDVVEPRAQCVECVLTPSNAALKLSNLKRHLETRHPALTHIQNQVLERMKGSRFFSIQLDESTDVSKAALVLFFVRYHWSGILQEDMLFCGELPTRTIAQEYLVLFMLIKDCTNRFKSLFESLFGPIYLNII